MDVGAVIIELAPNCETLVDEWVSQLNRNKREVIEGLVKETVEIESYFRFSLEGKCYLIGYMRAESLQVAKEYASTSIAEVDRVHNQFKTECWAKVISAELLLDFNVNPFKAT